MSSAESPPEKGGGEALPRAPRLEVLLFAFALLVYTVSRLVGLTRFPIFFFCDEALQGNLADQLLRNGLRDHTGTFLPPYFLNDQRWAVSLSVYIHLIPVWLFGKSVFVIRATSVAVTLLGAAALGVALRTGLKNRFWWAAPLVLAILPVQFLHARTGFETAMMVSFFGCFLAAYLLYRYRSPLYIFAALLFGAATFYAYTAGQGVMLVTGILLLLSDLPYHVRQKKRILAGAALFALLLASPYVRYRRLHPGVIREQLDVIDSYWVEPIPLSDKLERFGRTYLQGFDPRYWFLPHERELPRHTMKDRAFFPFFILPFVAVGIGVCLWKFGSSAHRAVLLSPLGVPFSAAAAQIQILRLLAMIVPVTLLALIGFDQIARWARRILPSPLAAVLLAGALTVQTARLTETALVDGPTWYSDYGLYGMQYGAPQVFRAIREELAQSGKTQILLTPVWSNNTDAFLPFFLSQEERERVRMAAINAYALRMRPVAPEELFVMTPEEFASAKQSGKFVFQAPERVIPYPDGRPGFYFVRFQYAPDAEAVFAAEREARQQLKEEAVPVDGETVIVRHSQLDMGALTALFDGRNDTLIRGAEANPFLLEVLFPTPRAVKTVRITLGSMSLIRVRIRTIPAEGEQPREQESLHPNPPPNPMLAIPVPGAPEPVRGIRLEITDVAAGEVTNMHVRELSFSSDQKPDASP